MGKVLRRTGWTVMTAGALGMINPGLAQMPMNMVQAPLVRVGQPVPVLAARPVGNELQSPGVNDGVKLEDMVALEEMKLELAWLANPATFPYQLRAQVRRTAQGAFVEISGFILNEAVREQALQTARATTKLPLVDSMRVYPGLTLRSGSSKPDTLRAKAIQALTDAFGEQASRFEVTTTPTGQVTVSGVIASFEEKLSVSRLLKRLSGCSCVDNRLNVNIVLREGKPHVVVSVDGRRTVPLATPIRGSKIPEPDRQVRLAAPAPALHSVTLAATAPARVVSLGANLPTSAPTVVLPSQYQGAPARTVVVPMTKTLESSAIRQTMPAYQMIAASPQPARSQTQLSTVVRGPAPGTTKGQAAVPVTVGALTSEYMPVTPPRPGSRVAVATAIARRESPDPAASPATAPTQAVLNPVLTIVPSPTTTPAAPQPAAAPIVPVDFRAVVQNQARKIVSAGPGTTAPAVSTASGSSPEKAQIVASPPRGTPAPATARAKEIAPLPPAVTTTPATPASPVVMPMTPSVCGAGACQIGGVSGKPGPACFPPVIDTASAVKPLVVQSASTNGGTKPTTAAPRILPGTMVSAPLVLPANQKNPSVATKPVPRSVASASANSEEVHVLQASYKTNAAPENASTRNQQHARGAGTTWSWRSLFGSKESPSGQATAQRSTNSTADGKSTTDGTPNKELGLWTAAPQATLQASPTNSTIAPAMPADLASMDNLTSKVAPGGTEKPESAAAQRQPYSVGTMSFSIAPSDPAKAVPAATIGVVSPASHVVAKGAATQQAVTMGFDAQWRARFKQRVEAACGRDVKGVEVKMQPNGQLCVVLTVPGTTDIEALSKKVFELPEIISKQVHTEIVLMP